MLPLEHFIQWEIKSEGLPRAQVRPDMWRGFYIIAGLDTLTDYWVQVLRKGDRMDRFLFALEMIPWATKSRQFYLHRLRGLLYGWLIQYPGDRRIKWEITPICYTGPVMLKVKDNRLNKDGMWVSGSLGNWFVDKDGRGIVGFNEDPTRVINFHIDDILKEPDDELMPSRVLPVNVKGGAGGRTWQGRSSWGGEVKLGRRGQAGEERSSWGGEVKLGREVKLAGHARSGRRWNAKVFGSFFLLSLLFEN
ncbi:hypothetical protein LTS15_006741 [Exophiala xenobiotica]|nr:hypothetical protein LTS15_006741 [Exophiala xenobiotica]